MLVWIPLCVFAVHIVEEYPRFPAWASRHFGQTSRAWYVYSHIVLVGALAAVAWSAHACQAKSGALLLTAAIEVSLVANGLFHAVTTWLFKRYSPGLVTAALLFIPSAAYLFRRIIHEELLTPNQLAIAVALGAFSQVLVVASLWLPLDLDWHFRRRQTLAPIPN